MHDFMIYTLVIWLALGAVVNILMIGKPRPVTTPVGAVIGVLIICALIAGILAWLA